jgi:uncharacterized membrane protein
VVPPDGVSFHDLIFLAAKVLEGVGVAIIVVGIAVVMPVTIVRGVLAGDLKHWYREVRQGVGRTIMLGLEILVGADIIRTVAEVPTLYRVGVLAGIVAIRTFLSFTLEAELEGRWPWQMAQAEDKSD